MRCALSCPGPAARPNRATRSADRTRDSGQRSRPVLVIQPSSERVLPILASETPAAFGSAARIAGATDHKFGRRPGFRPSAARLAAMPAVVRSLTAHAPARPSHPPSEASRDPSRWSTFSWIVTRLQRSPTHRSISSAMLRTDREMRSKIDRQQQDQPWFTGLSARSTSRCSAAPTSTRPRGQSLPRRRTVWGPRDRRQCASGPRRWPKWRGGRRREVGLGSGDRGQDARRQR